MANFIATTAENLPKIGELVLVKYKDSEDKDKERKCRLGIAYEDNASDNFKYIFYFEPPFLEFPETAVDAEGTQWSEII